MQSLETLAKSAVLKMLCEHPDNKDFRSGKRIVSTLTKARHVLPHTSDELATLLEQRRQLIVLKRQHAHFLKIQDKFQRKFEGLKTEEKKNQLLKANLKHLKKWCEFEEKFICLKQAMMFFNISV